MTPFFEEFKDVAKTIMKDTGVPASVTLAQAALESDFGKHAPGNNYFGVKGVGPAGSQRLYTREVIHGKEIRVLQNFKKYHSADESFEDHAKVIMEGPLKEAMQHTQSAEDFVKALQSGPKKYATDPHYEDKILLIIKENNLEELDK